MVLELLAAFIGAIALTHGNRPNASGDAPHHCILGIHTVTKKERQVGRKVINVHTSRQIRFNVGESIRQCEGQLANRIGACLCYVIAADRHGVEISDTVIDKILLNITHDLQAEFS